MTSTHGFSTAAIHVGQAPDAATGAIVPPLYQASTFVHDGVGNVRAGFDYSRSGNPNRSNLQDAIAHLEGGSAGFAYSSGMCAEDAVLRAVLRPGDHVVLPNDVYGGTFRLVSNVLPQWGIDYTTAPLADVEAVAAAIIPGRTRVVWVESPSNPLLGLADIAALARIAHDAGALLIVDNTFASPYLSRPLSLGADIVTHSTTKYLGGHSDAMGGAVVVGEDSALPDGRVGPDGTASIANALAYLQNATGSGIAPFEAWLTSRGIKTLAVRMDRHCENAMAVASWLDARDDVVEVLYPGLETHVGHELAARQMVRPSGAPGFGGMVSLRLGTAERALDFCARTKIFALAVSLGGVESLIEYPGAMTHAAAAGSTVAPPVDLVRLSVGIEDVEDLLADLEQALGA